MAIDDRKQRIMMAIVSLYADEGEPVGSNLLSRHFNMAVSSATLRNEMAALTRLGLLEQPHTSAGRVPTAKGYRYYVDNLLDSQNSLAAVDRLKLNEAFRTLDLDPEKVVQGAAKALAELLGHAVIATTPRADDLYIAHFDVVQVGRATAAVLAVTAAGGVRTRVAKVDFELSEGDTTLIAQTLNKRLRFVAEADVDAATIRALVDSFGEGGQRFWPLLSAALTLMGEIGKPNVYFEGIEHLMQWPELENSLRPMIGLMDDPEKLESVLRPRQDHTTILFGDEFPQGTIPGLCFVTRQYLAGGGLAGSIAIIGPSRMRYRSVIPKLEYFSDLLGQSMNGALTG